MKVHIATLHRTVETLERAKAETEKLEAEFQAYITDGTVPSWYASVKNAKREKLFLLGETKQGSDGLWYVKAELHAA